MPGAPTKIVASLTLRDGKVLLCQRPVNRDHGGQWELPAGKVEEGEDLKAAVTRMMSKGLGVKVTYVALPIWKQEYPERSLRIVFTPVDFDGEPRPMEHAAVQWVTPKEALQLKLASLVRTFVETVLVKQTDTTMA